MALSTYGVKYRLDYSQVEGRKWRLDILKDGYASSVIDLTAQGEPCRIEWLGEDDAVSGVIGSVANINLYQETGQDLSEFYTADEEEFLVYLYYFDGVDYELYWKGFVIQDEYIEYVTTEPFQVNIKASDRIGTLNDYKCDEILELNDQPTPFEFIKECIDLTGLEFDFYDCSEFAESSIGNYTTSSAFNQVRCNAEAFLENPADPDSWVDVVTALDSVAKSYNCRIIQSKGALYAQNFSTSAGSDTEYKAHFYDYSASSWTATDVDKRVFDVQTELDPIGNNLIRRQSNARKFYTRNYKISPRNCFYNGDFELGTQGITANSNFAIESGNTQSGNKSASFPNETAVSQSTFDAASTATKTSTTGYTILQLDTFASTYQNLQWDSVPAVIAKMSFYHYVDVAATGSAQYGIRYSVEYQGTYWQFNSGYGGWSASFDYDTIAVTSDNFQKWAKEEFEVRLSVGAGSDDNVTLRIHSPSETGSPSLLFDNCRMEIDQAEYAQSEYGVEQKYLTTNSRQIDGSNTSGRITEDVLVGASSFGTYSAASNNPTVTLDEELAGVVYGQYYKAAAIDSIPELVKFDWRQDPRVSPAERALDLWCMIQNSELYIEPNKRYEGTFRDISLPDERYDLADDTASNWTEITADPPTSFDFDTFTFTFDAARSGTNVNTQRSQNILFLTAGQQIKIDATSGLLTNESGNELRLRFYRFDGTNAQTITWTSAQASTNKQVTYNVTSTAFYYLEAEAYSTITPVGGSPDAEFQFTSILIAVLDNPYSFFDLFNINFNTLSETNNHAPVKMTYSTKANRIQLFGFELHPVPNVLTIDYGDVRFRKNKL